MKTTFLHDRYAEGNSDIAQSCGPDDAAALKQHFENYGARENRGVRLSDYLTLEGVICSEKGHVYLAGWADRRIVHAIDLTIEVGYLSYDLGPIRPVWFYRDDVAQATGDTTRPSGFVAILKIEDLQLHSRVAIRINDQKMFETETMRWMSADHFLDRTLGACAMLADRPAGEALAAAEELYAPFRDLWSEFLSGVSFTRAFAHRTDEPVEQSIIIALYRNADMLIPQLECLAEALRDSAIEVIVVANQLQDAETVVRRLAGFCQLHDIRLALYLCPRNAGFSVANNFGADMARGQTLIFMNPDIFPPEQAPAQALDFLTSDPGDGLTGALLYYGDGMLMHSGMYVAADIASDPRSGRSGTILRCEHYGKGLAHHVDDGPEALEQALRDVPTEGLLVTAALWKIRKSLFDEMDGLSTDYLFAYYEDADFCLRLLQAGHPVRLDRTSRWIHMEGVGKPKSPTMRCFMWLNRALFTRRFAKSDLVAPAETDLFLL